MFYATFIPTIVYSVLPLAAYMSQNVRFWVWWVDLLRWAKIVICAYFGSWRQNQWDNSREKVAHDPEDGRKLSLRQKKVKID